MGWEEEVEYGKFLLDWNKPFKKRSRPLLSLLLRSCEIFLTAVLLLDVSSLFSTWPVSSRWLQLSSDPLRSPPGPRPPPSLTALQLCFPPPSLSQSTSSRAIWWLSSFFQADPSQRLSSSQWKFCSWDRNSTLIHSVTRFLGWEVRTLFRLEKPMSQDSLRRCGLARTNEQL